MLRKTLTCSIVVLMAALYAQTAKPQLELDVWETPYKFEKTLTSKDVIIRNKGDIPVEGVLTAKVDAATKKLSAMLTTSVVLGAGRELRHTFLFPPELGRARITFEFKDSQAGLLHHVVQETPYLLTPPPTEIPVFNTPAQLPVKQGEVFFYQVPCAGKRPLQMEAIGLPAGLKMNGSGKLSGNLSEVGDYTLIIIAKNDVGSDTCRLLLKVGNSASASPVAGWRSSVIYGPNVSDERIKSAAAAINRLNLINYGWQHIGVSDCWTTSMDSLTHLPKLADGFKNMKAVADYLHNQGMFIGLEGATPADTTASNTIKQWGIDRLDRPIAYRGDVWQDVAQKITSPIEPIDSFGLLYCGVSAWGGISRASKLPPSEQYSQLTMWAMRGAPMWLSCELEYMDAFTMSMLCNSAVMDIHRDIPMQEAKQVKQGDIVIWERMMSDGSKAVAIFNLSDQDVSFAVDFAALGLGNYKVAQDCWRQTTFTKKKKIEKTTIYSHGVLLLRAY